MALQRVLGKFGIVDRDVIYLAAKPLGIIAPCGNGERLLGGSDGGVRWNLIQLNAVHVQASAAIAVGHRDVRPLVERRHAFGSMHNALPSEALVKELTKDDVLPLPGDLQAVYADFPLAYRQAVAPHDQHVRPDVARHEPALNGHRVGCSIKGFVSVEFNRIAFELVSNSDQ